MYIYIYIGIYIYIQVLINIEMSEEEDIGIKEWISKGDQIKGAFKYRYSDFLVNEITEQNTVLFHNPLYLQ